MDAMLFQQIKSKTRSHLACSAGILSGQVDFKKLAIFYSTGHILEWMVGGRGLAKVRSIHCPTP